MADALEVIYSILDFRGVTVDELEEIRLKKKNERGGFQKRIILEETKE